ncbi:MAG: OmpA family protein [Thermodesulfobacteriota bacterium]
MRNRSLMLFIAVLVATSLVAGCGTMRTLKQDEKDRLENIQGMLEMADGKGAKECAPKEFAVAKADLDSALLECTQGWEKCNAGAKPAAEGLKAQQSVDALFKKLQECEDKKKVPTCGLVAEPETVAPGKCAKLKWSGENVELVYFGAEDKKKKTGEPLTGSREVCPKETTDYNMVCSGKYSTNYESVTVKVEEPPPPPPPPAPAPPPMAAPPPPPAPAPAPKMVDKMALRVNFDTGKAVIRKSDEAEMKKAVDFLKKYPDAKIHVVGYTDSRGGEKYNIKLSDQRADAVKKYLIANAGVKAGQITSEGKGPADPIGDNKTKEGQAMNRRVEIQILQ